MPCFLPLLLQKPWPLSSKFNGWVAGNSRVCCFPDPDNGGRMCVPSFCSAFGCFQFQVFGMFFFGTQDTQSWEKERRLGREAAHNDLTVCGKLLQRCFWQQKPPGMDLHCKKIKVKKKKNHDCYGILKQSTTKADYGMICLPCINLPTHKKHWYDTTNNNRGKVPFIP